MSIKRILFVFDFLALAGCSSPAAVSPTTQPDPTESAATISVTDGLGNSHRAGPARPENRFPVALHHRNRSLRLALVNRW